MKPDYLMAEEISRGSRPVSQRSALCANQTFVYEASKSPLPRHMSHERLDAYLGIARLNYGCHQAGLKTSAAANSRKPWKYQQALILRDDAPSNGEIMSHGASTRSNGGNATDWRLDERRIGIRLIYRPTLPVRVRGWRKRFERYIDVSSAPERTRPLQ